MNTSPQPIHTTLALDDISGDLSGDGQFDVIDLWEPKPQERHLVQVRGDEMAVTLRPHQTKVWIMKPVQARELVLQDHSS